MMLRWKYLNCFLIFLMVLSCSNKAKNDADTPVSEAVNESAIEEPLGGEAIPVPSPVMVEYEGELLNIFFHPLVAKPEIAFKGKMRNHFLEWFVTADEYKKILHELYIQDYVLVNISEIYEVTIENGKKKIIGKKPLVPEGKKPFILSVDDLNYYEEERENGFVHKLVIDDKGNIAAWTAGGNGGEISYDLDVVTITEDFIKQHPDFSIRGAKGIIALTGYEGVLGWHTHIAYEGTGGRPTDKLNDPEYEEMVEKVTEVVNKLKQLGWVFASHSWGHLNMPKAPMSWFTNDTNRWDREVRPIVGDTDLYIYPFGATLEKHEDKHKILRDRGFVLFFGVGTGYGYRIKPGYMHLDRRNIDGSYLRGAQNLPNRLFDIDKVMDREMRK